MQTVTVYYASLLEDKEPEVFQTESVNFLSCGVMELTVEDNSNASTLIAAVSQTKVIGIPLNFIERYEIT